LHYGRLRRRALVLVCKEPGIDRFAVAFAFAFDI
jgi:hypothetical protein